MLHLKDNYYIVKVPEDAYDVRIYPKAIEFYKSTGCIICTRDLPEGEWELIGEFDKQSIGFDTDNLLDKVRLNCGIDGYKTVYLNYIEGGTVYSKPLSFISLLNSKGIYWDNPFGEEPCEDDFIYSFPGRYDKTLKEWQEAESKKVKDGIKYLVIKKIK